MPAVSGSGGRLYLLASRPVPFAGEPLLPDRGGWFRVASPQRRFWDPRVPVVVETVDGRRVAPLELQHLGGRVRVDDDGALRASGGFLPASPIGEAASWQVETTIARTATSSLGDEHGSRVAVVTGAAVELAGVRWHAEPAAGAQLVAVMGCGAVDYLARGALTGSAGPDIRLHVEPCDLTLPTP